MSNTTSISSLLIESEKVLPFDAIEMAYANKVINIERDRNEQYYNVFKKKDMFFFFFFSFYMLNSIGNTIFFYLERNCNAILNLRMSIIYE